MLKHFYAHSIKYKLIYAIAAVHAVLMTIFIVDLVSRQQAFLIKESHDSAIGISKTLATNSIPWVLSNDLAGLDEIIRAQSQQSNFRFGMVVTPQGKVLAYHNIKTPEERRGGEYIPTDLLPATPSANEVVTFFDNDQAIDVATPILVNNTLIGWARVQMSRQQIYDSIQILTKEGLLYTLLAIIVGTLFAWIMGRNLTNGIYQLIHTSQRVRAGERNLTVTLNRHDELQSLSENFQSMLATLQEKEQALFAEKERAEITLKSIGDGVITTDREGRITYLNPVAEHLTGWSNHAAQKQPIEDVFKIYNELTMEPAANPALQSMEFQKIIALANHTVLINRAGEKISIEDSGAPIIDKDGQTIGAVLVFHDATEARQLRDRLTWQALHDSLTNLYNRQAFETRIEDLIQNTLENPGKQHVLIYLDLDQFKIVNDTVGHSAGDELLKQVATLFSEQVRDSDLLARLGGDEFAILLANCNTENALRVATQILKQLEEYRFTWENRAFDIGASVGIASIRNGVNKATVMSQADMACYLAKDQGRNRIHVFSEDDQSSTQEISQLDWVSRIKQAIEEERFILYAQEIVPLQKTTDKRCYEILVRLRSEDGKLITPNQFLPAAERFNLMGMLDAYIIEHAIQWLSEHRHAIERLNLNISGQSLDSEKFNDRLLELLKAYSPINHQLCFEITETAAITHMSASISFLNSVKNSGCQLALDDFGSGFSSFNWLKNLPVDFVKIDGAFILDVLSDPIDAAMVRAIHQISQEMNIQSIAEFVETENVSQWLKQVGIDYAQGYHYDQPKPIDAIFPT
ncbi:EAL domain-containing protein [Thiomicrorhabdus sp. zzn3]|uniref:EAL domain-containing protein n=1 Tax=Thiomicrorhabdus sp. zzn3 TaxID=3039775 RepID=UPI002436DD33|nr:EAL domain-containing protein [Thiomicrorhabdus sp. zzn3]MDG6777219.1 EAL domain-containing protein [Thiomicrorhabdus sp. zzn3]